MNKLIPILLILAISTLVYAAEDQIVLKVSVKYDHGNIIEDETLLLSGNTGIIYPDTTGEYIARLFSSKDELLFETKFDFALKVSYIPDPSKYDPKTDSYRKSDGYYPTEVEEDTKVLTMPYSYDIDRVEIIKDDELLLTIDLNEYNLCNHNKLCDEDERYELCPADCTEENASTSPETKKKGNFMPIIALIVLILIGFAYFKHKNNKF